MCKIQFVLRVVSGFYKQGYANKILSGMESRKKTRWVDTALQCSPGPRCGLWYLCWGRLLYLLCPELTHSLDYTTDKSSPQPRFQVQAGTPDQAAELRNLLLPAEQVH
ncbi:uncharacterized protein LOC126183525 isoform X2 [Schistocerca cancellata]|uniref:uncharacterized protein LOC126183525 isoform X2 n=1 Tax=Schistocerca cancellata TaxID=274614 RepID=UPI0021175F67|nr:uncharacterized protein LOC126183525 isoform X2 [Schistocerca cancellata]